MADPYVVCTLTFTESNTQINEAVLAAAEADAEATTFEPIPHGLRNIVYVQVNKIPSTPGDAGDRVSALAQRLSETVTCHTIPMNTTFLQIKS